MTFIVGFIAGGVAGVVVTIAVVAVLTIRRVESYAREQAQDRA